MPAWKGPAIVADDSVLFATRPVVTQPQPPVIVIGTPRSGSSFLAHVMSHIQDWYVFDDIYFYQKVKSIKADQSPLTKEQTDKLVHFLGWRLRTKIRYVKFESPNATWADVRRMCAAVGETYEQGGVMWQQLFEEWMTRLALHHGKSHWGYKVP